MFGERPKAAHNSIWVAIHTRAFQIHNCIRAFDHFLLFSIHFCFPLDFVIIMILSIFVVWCVIFRISFFLEFFSFSHFQIARIFQIINFLCSFVSLCVICFSRLIAACILVLCILKPAQFSKRMKSLDVVFHIYSSSYYRVFRKDFFSLGKPTVVLVDACWANESEQYYWHLTQSRRRRPYWERHMNLFSRWIEIIINEKRFHERRCIVYTADAHVPGLTTWDTDCNAENINLYSMP